MLFKNSFILNWASNFINKNTLLTYLGPTFSICKVSETFSLGTLCAKVTMHSYGEFEEFAAEKLVKVNFPPPGFIDAANSLDLREFICCHPESFRNWKIREEYFVKFPKTKQDEITWPHYRELIDALESQSNLHITNNVHLILFLNISELRRHLDIFKHLLLAHVNPQTKIMDSNTTKVRICLQKLDGVPLLSPVIRFF